MGLLGYAMRVSMPIILLPRWLSDPLPLFPIRYVEASADTVARCI
jgi:hypothetical protein